MWVARWRCVWGAAGPVDAAGTALAQVARSLTWCTVVIPRLLQVACPRLALGLAKLGTPTL